MTAREHAAGATRLEIEERGCRSVDPHMTCAAASGRCCASLDIRRFFTVRAFERLSGIGTRRSRGGRWGSVQRSTADDLNSGNSERASIVATLPGRTDRMAEMDAYPAELR